MVAPSGGGAIVIDGESLYPISRFVDPITFRVCEKKKERKKSGFSSLLQDIRRPQESASMSTGVPDLGR